MGAAMADQYTKEQEDAANANYDKTVAAQQATAITQNTGPLQVHYIYPPVPLDVAMLRGMIREEILMALPAICQAFVDILNKNGLVIHSPMPEDYSNREERQV
jgi:hypothetical protein